MDADTGDVSADPDLGVDASEDDADLADDPEPEEVEAAEAEDDDPDPETAKRLQQVQRNERRARESMAAERREFEAERERWREETREKTAALERFNQLKDRARVDLAAVAKELGVSEEEFEFHAEQLYRLSPKGQKDPRHKEIASRNVREREAAERLAKLEKQIKEREEREVKEREVAAQQKAAAEYLDQVQKVVTDKAPIVKYLSTKDPERAREKLRITAARMIKETGEVPAHAAVIRELEKTEGAKWKRLGIDIPGTSGTKDASTPSPTEKGGPKKKQPGAGETARPQPKTEVSERPAPKTQDDDEAERAEIVAAMRAGNLE